ncbi:MAG: hypothetical protein PHP21_05010, partial [Patescibacteria group bacterium]|nr:hypothetical protein [Patescibacteria group bacterium]
MPEEKNKTEETKEEKPAEMKPADLKIGSGGKAEEPMGNNSFPGGKFSGKRMGDNQGRKTKNK